MRFDPLDVVEAAYGIDLPEKDWIEGVLRAAASGLGGNGTFGYLFDASGPRLRVLHFRSVPRDIPMEQSMTALIEGVPREYVERTWLSCPFALASSIEGSVALLEQSGAPYRDVKAVNGFDASGFGFWVGTTLPTPGRVDRQTAARWRRVAAHLGAAYRLRRRLAGRFDTFDGASAVFTAEGGVAHAEGDAAGNIELAQLRRAVARLIRSRTDLDQSTDARLASRRGLVDARWSLVDGLRADGSRYIVARENEPSRQTIEALSPRERQVLASLAIGHTTKVVAYELGLSEATVRVLLLRAVRKLGASGRADAVERFRALAPQSEPEAQAR